MYRLSLSYFCQEHCYQGPETMKKLWTFAVTSILEEDVRPRLRMWSPKHIRDHVAMCSEYRDRYKEKLLGDNHSKENEKRLEELEKELDTFNININRQRAEELVNIKKKKDAESNTGIDGIHKKSL